MLTFRTYPIAVELLRDLYIRSIELHRACAILKVNAQFFVDISDLLLIKVTEKQNIDWQIVSLKIELNKYEKQNII